MDVASFRQIVNTHSVISAGYKRFLLSLPEEAVLPQNITAVRFAIQGGAGSFNEQALRSLIGAEELTRSTIQYCYTTDGALSAVASGEADVAHFAVLNSIGGAVQETEESISKFRFEVLALHSISIKHYLMIPPDLEWSAIETIAAHPQVLKQCQQSLANKFPQCRLVSGGGELLDTARMAQAVAERDPRVSAGTAVLGPKGLAERFSFRCSDRSFEDRPDNRTWFVLVGTASA